MRLVQVMIPAGMREAVVDVLEEEDIDYVVTDETSGREYTAVVTFPLPTNAVEPVLDRLRDAGIDEEAYTVVLDAQTVISRKFERLVDRYQDEEEETSGTRIAREELRAQAVELAPDFAPYLVMTVVSAVVATAGVLIDSPAVVVGSMVIAPLVGPAMATSVGSVVDDDDLFRRGVRLQVIGILVATVAAAVFALLVRTLGLVPPNLDVMTLQQFQGRLTPDFLSLAVALGAGVAGAVSVASGVSIALVGVMIAAALVPPIAVVGIGIAWQLPTTVLSSGVLVLVNVLSINLAALAVLWYMGYRPDRWFRRDAARTATIKRMGVLVVAILALSLFLGGTTVATYQKAQFEQNVHGTIDRVVGPESTGPPDYQRLQVLEFRVTYDSELPFQQAKEVVVTVGRPVGVETPDLAEMLQRRINAETSVPLGFLAEDRQVKVEVRYVEVDEGSPNEPQDAVASSNALPGPSSSATAAASPFPVTPA